jgi:hypothetical protein
MKKIIITVVLIATISIPSYSFPQLDSLFKIGFSMLLDTNMLKAAWDIQKEAYKLQLETMEFNEDLIKESMKDMKGKEKEFEAMMKELEKKIQKQNLKNGKYQIQMKILHDSIEKKFSNIDFSNFDKIGNNMMKKIETVFSKTFNSNGASSFSSNNSINLNFTNSNDSKNNQKVIKIQNTSSDEPLHIKIGITANQGEISIKIHEPDNDNAGGINIGNKNQNYSVSNGTLDKTYNNPKIGIWEVRIHRENASGSIEISSSKSFKNK